jgi:RHS repeat-associated protein
VRCYQLPSSDALPEGGYEVDVVFSEKPNSNIVAFNLNTQNLDFLYQPPLDKEEHGPDVISCEATKCVDAEGEAIIERPENVVGSYAAYYKDGKTGDYSEVGGKNYRAGKAFHIYRPKITDSAGNSVWGSLNIDKEAGTLTVTVPQEFLEKATYPVTVDPTLGYTTCGASDNTLAADANNSTRRSGNEWTMPQNGTLSSLHACLKTDAATDSIDVAMFLNAKNSIAVGSHGEIAKVERTNLSVTTTATWYTFAAANQSLTSGTTYTVNGLGDGADVSPGASTLRIRTDSGTANQEYFESINDGYATLLAENPWTNTPGNTTTNYSYYATHVFAGDSSRIQDISYTYDNVGNITQIADYSGTDAAKIINYVYDDLYRLTSASTTIATSTQSGYLQTYTYNSIGNITNKSDVGSYIYAGDAGSSYANPHAGTTIGSETMTYDRAGNLTSNGTWNYGYDWKGRIVSASTTGVTTSARYTYNDIRANLTEGSVGTDFINEFYFKHISTTTKHIYAGDMLVATIEKPNGTTTPVVSYIHSDHLGGTNVITNSSGKVMQTLDYYPFGSIRVNKQTTYFNEKKKFTGTEYDNNTGLSYMQARYQNGTHGRFLSQDPVFVMLGANSIQQSQGRSLKILLSDPQGLNSYSYARNNPLKYVDTQGKLFWLIPAILLGYSIASFAIDTYDAYTVRIKYPDTFSEREKQEVIVKLAVDVGTTVLGNLKAFAPTPLFERAYDAIGIGLDAAGLYKGGAQSQPSQSNQPSQSRSQPNSTSVNSQSRVNSNSYAPDYTKKLVIAQPGSKREPMGESAFWIA